MSMLMKRFSGVRVILVGALLFLMFGCSAGNSGQGAAESPNASQSAQSTQSAQNSSSGAASEAPAEEQEEVTLRFYTVSSYDKLEYDEIMPEWKELHPNINVEIVVLSGADGWDKIRTAIAGGEKIDVTIMERSMFQDKAPKMYWKLNDFLAQAGVNYLEDFGEYGRATMVRDDIYGISKILTPSAVIYNQSVFDQAGVPLPDDESWTYTEYFDMIKKLTQKDGNGNTTVYGGMHWAENFAGILDTAVYGGWDVVTEDGKPNIDSPILKASVDMYYNAIFVDKSMPSDADIQATKLNGVYGAFTGQLGATLAASNNLLAMDEFRAGGQLPEEADEQNLIGLLKMPRWDRNSPPSQITTIVTSYSIAASTDHPEEAFEFLLWHTTKGLELSAKVAHRIPAWKQANVEQLIKDWRYYPGPDGKLIEGKNRDDIYKKALDPSLVAIFPKYRGSYPYSSLMLEELQKELSLVLAGEKPVDDALAAAQKASEAIYEKEKN